MANLIVAGAAGRMGRLLVSIIVNEGIASTRRCDRSGQVTRSSAKMLAKSLALARQGVKIVDDYAAVARPDTVTLDFTNAVASLGHLEIAASNGAAIVIGSTGFTPEIEMRAQRLAQRTRTVIAPNMSIGVNVLMKITAEVARILATSTPR